jgi:hypothetical protein
VEKLPVKEIIVKKTSFKHYTLGALALSALFLVGCLGESSQGPSSSDEVATLSVSMVTRDVNPSSALAKASTISLSKLVVTMTSNATPADTVRDTIEVGENGFVALATSNQTVSKVYTLKALRTWTIVAKTLDSKDSVVHTKTDSVVNLPAGAEVSKSLSLAPRFVMYSAAFNFPDSLASSPGPGKQKMNVTRLVMKVDGITVVDSSATFSPATAYSIGYDYVPVNIGTTVELLVIGNLEGWARVTDTTLYGKTDIAVTATGPGVDGSHSVTLPYVGPVTGKTDLEMVIQKVGLYQITATTDSAGVPKRK